MHLPVQAFVSATARWPVPYGESGSTSNHYYSCVSSRLELHRAPATCMNASACCSGMHVKAAVPAWRRFEFGLVHAIALSLYQPVCGGSLPCQIYNPGLNITGSASPQYTWLANDLAKVWCRSAANLSCVMAAQLPPCRRPTRCPMALLQLRLTCPE